MKSKSITKKGKGRIEVDEKELDRFAGSSEEDSDEDEPKERDTIDNDEDEGTTMEPMKGPASEKVDESDSFSDDDSEDEEQRQRSGMASAMSKILGGKVSQRHRAQSVVLSKTVTPLQKKMKAEEQKEKEAREKRKLNRERNLTALHIPLSVAESGSSAHLARELELERTHRRVATRGVVALFNAIAQHQNQPSESQAPKGSARSAGNNVGRKQEGQKLSKHGFLEAIKTSANKRSEKEQENQNQRNGSEAMPERKQHSKWNALKDDYMMNSKLKDWDKDSSDGESDDENEEENREWSDDDDDRDLEESTRSKRQRTSFR